ncbi:MAG: type II toxin-antitoxin system RelE/ParE family toxin [Rhodoferax sp.]|nr:type II toxin-antitoxin system RelE/ParE family toxin [Rhodoferax sp.]
MLTIIETPIFQRMVRGVMDESELSEFITFISNNPLAGDVIPGVGDLRKVRWARQGMGKRGGARVIYFNRLASGEVVLVATYAKAKFDNIPISVLKMWKEAYDG